MPSWLKGKITREEAEDFVKPFEDGKFVVRAHTSGGAYVLCVVYKDKPTHHLMTTDDDGNILVNKKNYGNETSDVENMITYLGSKRAGWPVPLDKPCGGGGGGGGEGTPWLHPESVDKERSETLLAAGGDLSPSDDGRFLIRSRVDAGQYVLSLVYKGKPTQHLIKPNAEGSLCVNNKPYGGTVTDIAPLVAALALKPQGWPVKLKEYIDGSGKVCAWGSAGASPAAISAAASPAVKKAGSLRKSSSGSVKAGQPWLHDKMSNPEAVAKFDGSTTDGTFFVRKHSEHIYALSVIYKGKPTHHLLKAPPTAPSTVGGKVTGIKGLSKTIEHLRQARPGVWPVALGDHIPNGKKSSVKGSIRKKKEAAAAAAAAEAEPAGAVIAEDDGAAAAEAAAAAAAAAAVVQAAAEAKAAADAAAAAAAAEATAEQQRQAAAAEDNKVTGFYQLKNPFPKAESGADAGYISIGPGSELLAEARHLARATASNLSSETRANFGVGKPMKMFGAGLERSTDDWEPEEYDLSDGTGTAPSHMSMMSQNPYMAPVGMIGTKGGLEKLAQVQKKVREMQIDRKTTDGRVQTLEDQVQVATIRLTNENAALNMRTEHLEKKIALLEQLLINSPSSAEGDTPLITICDIRLIGMSAAKPAGKVYGMGANTPVAASSGKPTKKDLLATTLLGKIRLLKDATYADVRRLVVEEFDDAEIPAAGYKFYTVEDGEADLLKIHEKQESRIKVDTEVVYMVADKVDKVDPRTATNKYF